MKNVLLFFGLIWGSVVFGQDFLSAPNSNPALFKKQNQNVLNEKQQVIEPSFIYEYDTLQLPFIDDFSKNHFPKRQTDTTGLRDTTIYSIFRNGLVYKDTFGFTTDTTFRYFLSTAGDTISFSLNGPDTILFADISNNRVPVYRKLVVFRAFTFFDRFGTDDSSKVAVDAVYIQDSNEYKIVPPNSNDFYTDRQVYLNNTFGIEPPSIGVVTFDGLNEYGLPYDLDFDFRIVADTMTSVPINLSALPDTNVYFSFYYQPKGLAIDKPEREDSLVLEFYNPMRAVWSNVWDTTGFKSEIFRQVNLKVPNTFHQNGFQFRFKNYGTPTGGFDNWHVDYIYLNNGRSVGDTIRNDIAYVYDAPSLLKGLYAMPFFHFRSNPQRYMADTAFSVVNNLSANQLPLYNFLNVPDTTTGTDFYQFPASNSNFVPIPADSQILFMYPLDFVFPANKIGTCGVFKSPFTIDFRPGSAQEKDFIRSNDTIIGRTVLKNYYAYDDGTAEAGYGVNPEQDVDGRTAFIAVRFKIPFKDTLKGIQTYFYPQTVDVRKQTFLLTVWSNLTPPNIMYQDTMTSKPVFSEVNGFVGYQLDSALVVDTNFFVGIKAIGLNSLNMGYDLNTNTRDNIFWSQDGNSWQNPSAAIFDGSLMLRPVFRDRVFDVGITENKLVNNNVGTIKLYPNPAAQNVFVEIEHFNALQIIELFDLNGKLISNIPTNAINSSQYYNGEQFSSKLGISVSTFNKGIYLLKFTDETGASQTQKFIVNR